MDAHVVIATKGRAAALPHLLTSLSLQTLQPRSVTFVGATASDVEGVLGHPFTRATAVDVLVASAAGSSLQRNLGVQHVIASRSAADAASGFFIAFFDDDYRPASDWLEQAARAFESQRDIAGLTGWILADGINGDPLNETDAADYIEGRRAPLQHWATGSEPRELSAVYGCNMAFRDRVVTSCRFDENLPLYGWQEDRDYTSQARALGRTIYLPTCRGVHLGAKSGRVSGVRFGYSQIANPFYLWRKGTMTSRDATRFVARHLLSNSARTFHPNPRHDYRGRLRGNMLAFADLVRGTCNPRRILELG